MQNHDILGTTKAISAKTIRLTRKQWTHITESHDYMAGNIEKVMQTVAEPDCLARGKMGAIIAIKHYPSTNITEKDCIVVYKETDKDGFIITAFLTSKPETIKAGSIILWQK